MGIKSIKCEGYPDVKESVFGKGNRTSSDFSGKDSLKAGIALLAGTLAAGCIETVDREPLSPDAKYDIGKPIGAGTIITEYNRSNGYELLVRDDVMSPFDRVAIVPLKNDEAINFCMIEQGSGYDGDFDRDMAYILACASPVKDDGIGMGERVAIYKAHEVASK